MRGPFTEKMKKSFQSGLIHDIITAKAIYI